MFIRSLIVFCCPFLFCLYLSFAFFLPSLPRWCMMYDEWSLLVPLLLLLLQRKKKTYENHNKTWLAGRFMTCFSIGFSIPFLSFFFFSLSAFFHLYMYSMTMVLISFFVCLFDVLLLFFHSFFLYYLVCFLCFHYTFIGNYFPWQDARYIHI